MRIETHVIIRAVGFCVFATAVAITAEKEVATSKRAEAATAQMQLAGAEKEIEVTPELVKRGEALYSANGCVACHSTDGSMRIGPSFLGLYGKQEKLADGTTVKVDEAYLRESILKPSNRVVAGYMPTMPSFESSMDRGDQDAIIAWLKSLH